MKDRIRISVATLACCTTLLLPACTSTGRESAMHGAAGGAAAGAAGAAFSALLFGGDIADAAARGAAYGAASGATAGAIRGDQQHRAREQQGAARRQAELETLMVAAGGIAGPGSIGDPYDITPRTDGAGDPSTTGATA